MDNVYWNGIGCRRSTCGSNGTKSRENNNHDTKNLTASYLYVQKFVAHTTKLIMHYTPVREYYRKLLLRYKLSITSESYNFEGYNHTLNMRQFHEADLLYLLASK